MDLEKKKGDGWKKVVQDANQIARTADNPQVQKIAEGLVKLGNDKLRYGAGKTYESKKKK